MSEKRKRPTSTYVCEDVITEIFPGALDSEITEGLHRCGWTCTPPPPLASAQRRPAPWRTIEVDR